MRKVYGGNKPSYATLSRHPDARRHCQTAAAAATVAAATAAAAVAAAAVAGAYSSHVLPLDASDTTELHRDPNHKLRVSGRLNNNITTIN